MVSWGANERAGEPHRAGHLQDLHLPGLGESRRTTQTAPCWAVYRDLKGSVKANMDIDTDVDVDFDRYLSCLNGVSKSVQVLLNGNYRSSHGTDCNNSQIASPVPGPQQMAHHGAPSSLLRTGCRSLNDYQYDGPTFPI